MTTLLKDPTFTALLGAIIGFLFSFLIALFQKKWAEKEAVSQRLHEKQLLLDQRDYDKQHFQDQKRHDKDMQRRDNNIRNTGIADMREIGGG